MRSRWLLLATVLVVAGLAAGLTVAQPQAGLAGGVATLSAYRGSVAVVRQAAELRPYPGLPLWADDRVTTRDGEALVRFPDGSELRVRPESSVAISGRAQAREVEVFFGRLWAYIAKRKDQDTRFKTGGTIAAVRGTVIEIGKDPEATTWAVNEGELRIKITIDGQETEFKLLAGQWLTLRLDGSILRGDDHKPGAVAPETVELEEITATLERVIGMEGNNAWDPDDPGGEGETPVPTATETPRSPTATPTPEPTPGTPSPSPSRTPRPQPTEEPEPPRPTPTRTVTPTPTPTTSCLKKDEACSPSEDECCEGFECRSDIESDRLGARGGAGGVGASRAGAIITQFTCQRIEEDCAGPGEACIPEERLAVGASGASIAAAAAGVTTGPALRCCPGSHCDFDGEAGFFCDPDCNEAGESCSSDGDCCSGKVCRFNGSFDACCIEDGNSCSFNFDCCSGTCLSNICFGGGASLRADPSAASGASAGRAPATGGPSSAGPRGEDGRQPAGRPGSREEAARDRRRRDR